MTTPAPEPSAEYLAIRADQLRDSVDQFVAQLAGVSGIEERQTVTEREQHRQNRWVRLTAAGLVLDVLLSLGLGGFALWQRASERRLCHYTQKSWDFRQKTAEIQNMPAVLSPQIRELFPAASYESLRIQIDQANATKKVQLEQLTKLNGERPRCK